MKTLKQLLLLALLAASPSWAAPIDDAIAADAKGDYATELRIVRPLAEQGEAWAQYFIGIMYDQGQGVVQDYAEAAKWFNLAAAQGRAEAQYNLGNMYAKGQGVVQDYAEAVKWYKLAAAQGYAEAQYFLGIMYSKGLGVVQDHVRAHMWFNLAAVSGNKDAIEKRDIAAGLMTPQQIGEAQKLARECQAQQFKNCSSRTAISASFGRWLLRTLN